MAGSTSGISPSFLGLSRSSGQVTHVVLTRSRLCPRPKPGSSLHLHVLSTPPAFVLSQDQTLRKRLAWIFSGTSNGCRLHKSRESVGSVLMAGARTPAPASDRRVLLRPPCPSGNREETTGRTWTRPIEPFPQAGRLGDRTLLRFQRPRRSLAGGDSALVLRCPFGPKKGPPGRGPRGV